MSAAAFEAVRLRGNRYAVKPAGTCGTCGWIDGNPWQVVRGERVAFMVRNDSRRFP